MRALVIFGDRDKILVDNLILCLFIKILVSLPLGPVSFPTMDSLPDLEYQAHVFYS